MWPFVTSRLKNPAAPSGLWLLVLFIIAGCGPANQKEVESGPPDKKSDEKAAWQKPGDLLAGTHKAICYSGFRTGQHPDRGKGAKNPSYEQVLEDLLILSEEAAYDLIRMYDCGENTEMTLGIIRENDLNVRVLLGIWLRAEFSNHETCEWLTEPIPEEELLENKKLNKAEIKKGISLANEFPEIIVAVNVGNEALVDWNDHKVPVDTVIAYVREVKNAIEQPVTVADNYKWWADHGTALAKAVDFVSIHIYPVWEGKDIGEGMSYSLENIQLVQKTLPGSRIVITEAGWPSIASEFGDRANEEKQKQYVEALLNWSEENHFTTFIFEAFDEDWKGNPDNPMGAEKHWGLFNVDRTPKKVMKHIYSRNK
jgi:exo-beta-1,3-glucanase (GH17 family)